MLSVTWELKKKSITRLPLIMACLLLIPYVDSFILGLCSLTGSQQKLHEQQILEVQNISGEILGILTEIWWEEDMRWHGKILSGFTEAGIPSSYPWMFCWPPQPFSKASLRAASEPLHPLVRLQWRLCLLDQCFLNAGRKDGTCWLQTRCQSMQRGLYCKQSLKIHFKGRKGWGEEKQNTQRCWLAIYSHPPSPVIHHLPLCVQQTSYTHSSFSLLLEWNLIFVMPFVGSKIPLCCAECEGKEFHFSADMLKACITSWALHPTQVARSHLWLPDPTALAHAGLTRLDTLGLCVLLPVAGDQYALAGWKSLLSHQKTEYGGIRMNGNSNEIVTSLYCLHDMN